MFFFIALVFKKIIKFSTWTIVKYFLIHLFVYHCYYSNNDNVRGSLAKGKIIVEHPQFYFRFISSLKNFKFCKRENAIVKISIKIQLTK